MGDDAGRDRLLLRRGRRAVLCAAAVLPARLAARHLLSSPPLASRSSTPPSPARRTRARSSRRASRRSSRSPPSARAAARRPSAGSSTACAFLELLFCALILLGLSHLHSHVEDLVEARTRAGDDRRLLRRAHRPRVDDDRRAVRDMIHAKLQRHAKKRLLALTANELKARQGSRRCLCPAERSASPPPGAIAASKSHARYGGELAECRRIVDEEMWRVFDVQLMVDNGKMLLQGLRKAPQSASLRWRRRSGRGDRAHQDGLGDAPLVGALGRSSRISEPSDRRKNDAVSRRRRRRRRRRRKRSGKRGARREGRAA